MPMSAAFEERLFPHLPKIVERFGTPFHIYDELGILRTGERLKKAFADVKGFQEFYAVKALPNPRILGLMHEMGFGFDCSSIIELELAREAGARPEDIMFTSNNTTVDEFGEAVYDGGCIVNLDDVSLIEKFCSSFHFPGNLACFRYNPGNERTGNSIIGEPAKAKYGITTDQLLVAYTEAIEFGAKRFGLHTMVCSNERNYSYMVETVRMLLEKVRMISQTLDITFDFINMGGGIGIPYDPTQHTAFDLEKMGEEIREVLADFKKAEGWVPKLFMESGRFMTGPHGVLVARAINRKDIYEKFIGVDTGMPALMRHAMYGAYHHITVLDKAGRPRQSGKDDETVSIVGSICENCDRLATNRLLPKIHASEKDGDLIVTHDTGAHGIAMGFNYNGRTRPQELLLGADGSVELIRRAETIEDLRATLNFEPETLNLH